jgi:soluble lytic murein transglycosylase-like protein
MQRFLRLGLIAVSGLYGLNAHAKDQAFPALPCPIEGELRVAGAGSLTGFSSLDECAGKIIIAPANPSEYVEPQDLRISPERGARVIQIMASSNDGSVVRIAPTTQEPLAAAFAAGDGSTSADTILAMRPVSYSTPYDDMITRVAERHRIDPLLLHAVIKQESQYKERATSHAGARGLMQLMPATARMLGIGGGSITHAESNVDGGARLLRRLYGKFNDFPLVLAAYNAGEGAVAKYGNQIPPYRETQDYVRKVLANYQQLAAEQPTGGR